MADQGLAAWFGVEVLTVAPSDAGVLSYVGVEVLVPYYDRAKEGWFGVETLTPAINNAGRTAWFGVEVLAVGWSVDSVTPSEISDAGGVKITIAGTWPAGRVKFAITDGVWSSLCYSGSIGDGPWVTPGDAATVDVWARPLPIGGPYDIVMIDEDTATETTGANLLTVVHRSFTTALYSLRSAFPPPRDVGPYAIDEEE